MSLQLLLLVATGLKLGILGGREIAEGVERRRKGGRGEGILDVPPGDDCYVLFGRGSFPRHCRGGPMRENALVALGASVVLPRRGDMRQVLVEVAAAVGVHVADSNVEVSSSKSAAAEARRRRVSSQREDIPSRDTQFLFLALLLWRGTRGEESQKISLIMVGTNLGNWL